ncbi:MAG: carboxypeptidase-like regulatory domain-containing protein, partial [Bdellovibrionaceae bacterium]|nr:carboxypeptidase-like regulatory domain-containing protein [Pseudobdellovibrionaceae bacterium]
MKLSLFLILFTTSSVLLAKTFTYQGQLLEKGTQLPLKEASIFLLPQKLKVQTDEKGYFKFND